jgi:hypothetical protein
MFITLIILGVVVLAVALTGFIFVQIKARLIWRLMSIAIVGLVCFGVGGIYYTNDDADKMADYDRGTHDFVEELDVLATQGRTNDVHQLCQRFDDDIFLGGKNTAERLDKLVEDAYRMTKAQPNKSPEPTAVGAGSSATRSTP